MEKMKVVPPDTIEKVALYCNSVTSIVTAFFKYGTFCFVAYMVFKCCESLSGKITLASFGMDFLANVSISTKLAYLTGAGGVGYGYYERRLRKKQVALLSDNKNALEKIIDPKRTSSGLSRDGSTKGTNIR